jgi:hypothetical protein
LHLLAGFGEPVGEFADAKFPASFEHGDTKSAAGQARCGDASTVTGADNDRVVLHFEISNRAR